MNEDYDIDDTYIRRLYDDLQTGVTKLPQAICGDWEHNSVADNIRAWVRAIIRPINTKDFEKEYRAVYGAKIHYDRMADDSSPELDAFLAEFKIRQEVKP